MGSGSAGSGPLAPPPTAMVAEGIGFSVAIRGFGDGADSYHWIGEGGEMGRGEGLASLPLSHPFPPDPAGSGIYSNFLQWSPCNCP